MNELQERFEEKWKTPSGASVKTKDGSILFYDSTLFVQWLREQLTWRSVEDGLPDEGQEVLTISIAGTKDVTFLLNDGTWDNTLLITHWLPIPKLN